MRELARVATAGTESEWIDAARGLRVREVERLVSGRLPGDRPADTPRPGLEKHVLRFEVSAETLAAVRDALRRTAERSGQRLDDDAALLLLARAALDAEPDDTEDRTRAAGPARYQISVIECPRCKRGFMPAGADLLEMAPASLAAAHCDAQLIEATPDGADTQPISAPASGAHVGDTTPPAPTTQAIPRAVRRHVLARDHHTCRIPGCRNTHGLEVHHIVPRAEGGSNRAENLISSCGVHHPAIHDGQIHVSGTADALDVRHADGTPYGGAVSAHRSDTSEKVFRGLRWLGYKERDARSAIQKALRESGANGSALDDAALLRRALAHLG